MVGETEGEKKREAEIRWNMVGTERKRDNRRGGGGGGPGQVNARGLNLYAFFDIIGVISYFVNIILTALRPFMSKTH